MLIIVKDLSIFGMEYIEIDNIPLKNAPFIAVHDHYVEFYACLNGKPDGSFLTNPVLDSRFRQRKFCISILFLRNPKNRLKHCPVEFDNSMNRLRFGDGEKQCTAQEQEAAVCGVSVPTSLNLDRKAVVFVFR